jgi:hypothetical protein
MSDEKDLAGTVDQVNFELMTQKLMATRKVLSETEVTYDEISHGIGDKIIKLRGTHVPLDDVYKYASGSCKVCGYGRGYFISNISKVKYPNPRGLLVLEPETPEDPSGDYRPEQCWKIVNVCKCASEKALKKNPSWVATQNRNVFVALDFSFEDKPAEEVPVEDTKETVDLPKV